MLDRKDAYSAIPQLEKKIDAISTAQEEAGLNYDAFREQTRQELDVISGELVGVVTNVLQIESSNGLIFKDGIGTTQLNVTIYRGSEVISNYEQLTAQLGYTAYLRWSYLTDTGYVEIPASDSRLSNDSFTLTLSTADVAEKTTFKCELMLEGSVDLAELLAANQITIAKVLDGYSPTVTTGTASDGSTTVTVTNKDGSATTELVDGTARKDAADAAKVATNFLGYDSINGLIIGNKTSGSWSGYRSQILPGSFNVLDESSTALASFGPTTVIGEEAKANIHLTFNNLSMIDKDGTTLFEVGDNRNADGIATIKHTATATVNSAGSATVTVNSNISSIVSVYADSVQLSGSSYSFSQKDVTINNLTANSQTSIEITYTTTESTFYLTFGERDSSGNIGNYSVAEGYNVISSGYCSHAEGYRTTASGWASHAEGGNTTASEYRSHAEGYTTTASGWASHAEGYRTTASGYCSHAEGRGTTASGYVSHARGFKTVADGDYMTAIGRYNTRNSGKAFVIGNGDSDEARSNAFTVDWNGNATMKGGLVLGTALSIANGGTGATTAAGARSNLGINASNLGIKDYVVEQGTSGDWKYRKWNSGIAECFGYISLGSISVSAVGNVYRGNTSVSLPAIFNDIPSNVHITNGNPLASVISINGRATDADHVSVYIWKATKGAVDSVSASFYIIGTWK